MKTIKKLGKEYCKPDSNEVDWSKVVGKNCVVDCSICTGESGSYANILVEDFDPITELLNFTTDGETFWVDKDFYGNWVLMFVFEPEEKPVKKSNLSDEMKLLLEKDGEDDHNQARPFYPPQWPKVPTPYYDKSVKCSKCGIDFGNGPIGYVCPNYPCPTGLGGTYCSTLREYETGNITVNTSYAD